MVELVKVTAEQHARLRAKKNCVLDIAARQHVINIRASEVGRAACAFPIFFSRNATTGALGLSAVCGLEAGTNLFVVDGAWDATFQPGSMNTYPFFLMRDDNNDDGYVVGIDENCDAFSTTNGDRLFEDDGKESIYLANIKAVLKAGVDDDIQSFRFLKTIDEMGLHKAIDVVVHFEGGDTQTIKGLGTVDEDKLHALSAQQLEELNVNGYVLPMHAMLISIFQLNVLIRRQGKQDGRRKVTRIALEVARDAASDY